MKSSLVFRAALVGIALLGLSACTGEESGEEQESAVGSSSPSTSDAAPSTSSPAPETSDSSGEASASPQESASPEAEPSITVSAVSQDEEAAEFQQLETQVVEALHEGLVSPSERLVRTVASGTSTSVVDVPDGANGVVVTCSGHSSWRVRTGKDEWVTGECGSFPDIRLLDSHRTLTIEVEDDVRWAYVLYEGDAQVVAEEPEPPGTWDEIQQQVMERAAGVASPAGERDVQRPVIATMSSTSTHTEDAPRQADGVVVTCGGEGTGRIVVGRKGAPVTFDCGTIVEMALPSSASPVTIEVEDDTWWTVAYYEETTPAEGAPLEAAPAEADAAPDWEGLQTWVRQRAAGDVAGGALEGKAPRTLVSDMSGSSTYTDQVPKGADGVVVACEGRGKGRLVPGAEQPIVVECGSLLDLPLKPSVRELTLEVVDDTEWTIAYYTEKPTAK